DFGALSAALAWIPVLLGACLLAARLFGDARLASVFAVAFLAVVPALLVVDYVVELVLDLVERESYFRALDWVFLAWAFAVLVRAQYVVTGWRGRSSAFALGL